MKKAKADREICKDSNDFLRPDHLMSEENKLFCESIRRFVDKEVIPHEDEFDNYWDWTERKEGTIVHQLYKRLLVDLGIQRSFVPEEYGGTGGQSSLLVRIT